MRSGFWGRRAKIPHRFRRQGVSFKEMDLRQRKLTYCLLGTIILQQEQDKGLRLVNALRCKHRSHGSSP